MTENPNVKLKERRRYFRINDEINLYYNLLEDATAVRPSFLSNDLLNNCSLLTAVDLMTDEARQTLLRIEQKDQDNAKYLAFLNQKIDLIAQALSLLMDENDEFYTRNVNLSASGVAFISEDPLQIGNILEIKMVLSTISAVIVTYAKVIYCNELQDSEHRSFNVGVDYLELQEQERELINKHIIKKQMQLIREGRGIS